MVSLSLGFLGLPFQYLGTSGLLSTNNIIAAVRRAKSIVGIILLNVLAGWTFIGWIIALVWSMTGNTQRT
jgi:hypothetical protein